MDIVARAVELMLERYAGYQRQTVPAPPAPEELRAAYDKVIYADDFPTAYQQFVAQYGADVFVKQQQLAMRRGGSHAIS